MFDARWSVVSWPEEFGGRDADLLEWIVFEEEYYRAQAPTRVGQNGIFLLAPDPLRIRHAAAAGSVPSAHGVGRRGVVPGMVRARRRQRPRRDPQPGRAPQPGIWVLSGQKTWCSRGAFAHWLFGLFRTDPTAERHRGLTYFLVPMDAPGVTVRPIAQLDGETGFAEVFFDDVVVPDDQVLGEIDHGWEVAMATAGSERGLSLRSPARYTEAAARLVELYAQTAADRTPRARHGWPTRVAARLHRRRGVPLAHLLDGDEGRRPAAASGPRRR